MHHAKYVLMYIHSHYITAVCDTYLRMQNTMTRVQNRPVKYILIHT